ncbi:hypothetical protein WJX82_000882 [Trebouxia sp. C0006]
MTVFLYYSHYPGQQDAAEACGYTGNEEKSLQWRLHHCRHKDSMRAAKDATELPDYEQDGADGTEGDATQAALDILKSINPKERVNFTHTDAGAARCNDCGQTVMGTAGRGFRKQDLADNIYCMGCRKEGMQCSGGAIQGIEQDFSFHHPMLKRLELR